MIQGVEYCPLFDAYIRVSTPGRHSTPDLSLWGIEKEQQDCLEADLSPMADFGPITLVLYELGQPFGTRPTSRQNMGIPTKGF
jgi:hypothetical protein